MLSPALQSRMIPAVGFAPPRTVIPVWETKTGERGRAVPWHGESVGLNSSCRSASEVENDHRRACVQHGGDLNDKFWRQMRFKSRVHRTEYMWWKGIFGHYLHPTSVNCAYKQIRSIANFWFSKLLISSSANLEISNPETSTENVISVTS